MSMGSEMLIEGMIAEVGCQLRFRKYLLELIEKGIWKTNNGVLVKIANMSSQHLRNTIALIDRESPYIKDCYRDILVMAENKMKTELSKRYPRVDGTEGFFDGEEMDYFEKSLL